jgi:hypothetical protein
MNDDSVFDEDEYRYWPHDRFVFDGCYDPYYARKWFWIERMGVDEYGGTIQ